MSKIGVNPPKTPVTEGSGDTSPATLPNVCKMPGPPAPFVPAPLPNIGKSSDGIKDGTTTVKFEGKKVAIKGSTYTSKLSPDMASKGTGGGLISAKTEGKTKFVAPGSMNVKADGKNIQLLGDAMSNNDDNAATMPGNVQGPQGPGQIQILQTMVNDCDKSVSPTDAAGNKKSCMKLGNDKHKCVDDKIQDHQNQNPPNGSPPLEGEQGYPRPNLNPDGSPIHPVPATPAPGPSRSVVFRGAINHAIQTGGNVGRSIGRALSGRCFPDAAILGPNGSKTFVDFKFPCPPGHPSGKGTSKGGVRTNMSPEQQGSYDTLGLGTGGGQAITILPI